MTNKMCFLLNINLYVLYWIIIYCNINQVFGCTSTTATHKRSGNNVTIQFQAITVNSGASSLIVTNQILSNHDSALLTALYRDGVIVYISSCNNCTFTGNASTGDLSIRIDKLQSPNGGTYKLSVTQASREVMGCVVVYILGVPTKPKVKLDEIPLEGESAVLTCSSTSTTTPKDPNLRITYNWRVNNSEANGQRYTYSRSKNILTIYNIVRKDVNLQFTCTATEDVSNAYTSDSSDLLRMNVYYAPFVKPFKVGPIVEGSSLSVECIVDPGYPILTTYIWKRKLNSSLANSWYGIPDSSTIGNQLVKQNISRKDVGLYKCTATNDITQTTNQQKIGSSSGTFFLDVLYPSSVLSFGVKGHKGTSTVILDENDEGKQLMCEIDSNPVSSVKILFKDNVKNESSGVNHVSFTLSSVSCLDSGDYSCEGSNRIGRSSRRNIQLLVNCTPRPLFRIDQNISSILHVQAMMSFTALAYPYPGSKGFSWQKENGANLTPVLANRDLLITSTALKSNLTILNITKTDYGRYRLIVNNSIGTFIQHFNLAETISDEGEGAKCDICNPICDPNKSTIITGVSLGIVNAILVGILVTILYRMKTNRKGSQSREENVRQEEYVNVSQSNIVEDKSRTGQYSVRKGTDISIANVTAEGSSQYMDLSEYSRDDKSTYDELKK